MFRAWCHAEGCEVLLTARRITEVRRFSGGVELSFTCWCGHAGTVVDRTGPAPTAATATATVPVEPLGPEPSPTPAPTPAPAPTTLERPALATA